MTSIGPLAKVCRLCGQREGPFANIFGVDMGLAVKIRELLPIKIDEWDDLPHKICFRCSGKVADLHEFVERCVAMQTTFVGQESAAGAEVRQRWETHLKSPAVSNKYNEELIKKALRRPSDNYKTEHRLKEFSIVLVDVDPTKKPKPPKKKISPSLAELKMKMNKQKRKLPTKSKPAELADNISFLDVSEVDSIYTCKVCHRIFTQRETIDTHVCSKKTEEAPVPVSIFYRNSPDVNADYEEKDSEYKVMSSMKAGKIIIKLNKKKTPDTKEGKISKKPRTKTLAERKEPVSDVINVSEEDPLSFASSDDSPLVSVPSFTLPVTKIVQESQISTTTLPPKTESNNSKNNDSKHSKMNVKKRKRTN